MDDIGRQTDEFAERLNARIEASRKRREAERAALEAGSQVEDAFHFDLDAANRIQAYDEQLARRIQEAYQMLGASLAARGLHPAVAGHMEITASPDLMRVDKQFLQIFQVRQHIAGADIRYPTLFCETLGEFFAPLLESLDLSSVGKQDMLRAMKAEAELTARETGGGGVFGMNLPGQGCYLNGWLFNYGRPGQPRDCLRDPRVLPNILNTAAHEKLGHGFITEFTALGAEKKALGLQNLEYARRFNLKVADTPTQALLVEKHNLVHGASEFTEEGWATWVAQVVIKSLRGEPRAPRYSLQTVWEAILQMSASAEQKSKLQSALSDLFLDPKADWEKLHSAIMVLQGIPEKEDRQLRAALDGYLAKTLGQPSPYIFGSLLMDKLEGRLGTMAVAYAVMIAASVTYDLRHISGGDLAHLIVTQPKLNPDSRLAALSTLELPTLGDVSTLVALARERLSLATPAELIA